MSWLGVAIGLGIAAVFLSLVFLILWLFPVSKYYLMFDGFRDLKSTVATVCCCFFQLVGRC